MKPHHCTFVPVFWARDPAIDYDAGQISLSAILPAAGESRVVYFEPFNLPPENQPVSLLWMPPLSEINGWDVQPSELLSSKIVSGTLRVSPAPVEVSGYSTLIAQMLTNSSEYEFAISSVEPLVQACRSPRNQCVDWNFPMLGQNVGSKMVPVNLWQDARWCGLAEIDGMQYLCASGQESRLEMLLLKERETMIALMHGYFASFSSELVIGAKTLSADESRLMESIMQRAVLIQDSVDAYLV